MKTAYTSSDLLQQMAFNSGRSIEILGDVAYLVAGDVVWTAKLAPAGGASS